MRDFKLRRKVNNNKFVITLLPEDGTPMTDKTCGEITAAYNAGREIVLYVPSEVAYAMFGYRTDFYFSALAITRDPETGLVTAQFMTADGRVLYVAGTYNSSDYSRDIYIRTYVLTESNNS